MVPEALELSKIVDYSGLLQTNFGIFVEIQALFRVKLSKFRTEGCTLAHP